MLRGGVHDGLMIVAKRAHDWDGGRKVEDLSEEEMEERVARFAAIGSEGREGLELGVKFLEVEAYMNDLIMDACPQAAAPYLGMVMMNGTR